MEGVYSFKSTARTDHAGITMMPLVKLLSGAYRHSDADWLPFFGDTDTRLHCRHQRLQHCPLSHQRYPHHSEDSAAATETMTLYHLYFSYLLNTFA